MTLYRRGPLYLAKFDERTGFVYDSATGASANVSDVAAYLGTSARLWRPVYEDDPIPDGLRARLVIPYKAKD